MNSPEQESGAVHVNTRQFSFLVPNSRQVCSSVVSGPLLRLRGLCIAPGSLWRDARQLSDAVGLSQLFVIAYFGVGFVVVLVEEYGIFFVTRRLPEVFARGRDGGLTRTPLPDP